jgi:hypothetical protein
VTFPAQSNAWSGSPDSLWWRSRYEGEAHICETQGRSAIVQLQRGMIADLPITFTADGTLFARSSIGVDGNVGPATLAAILWTLMNRLDAPTTMITGVRDDFRRLTASGDTRSGARGQPLSLATQQAGLWIGVHRSLPAIDAVILPPDIITWRFAIEAPNDGDAAGLITCTRESVLAGGGTRNNTSPGGSGDAATTGDTSEGSSTDDGILFAILIALGFAAAGGERKKKRR